MSLGILEALEQSRTRDRHRYHTNEHLRIIGSLLVGLTAFLTLLPFLLALTGKGILFVELTFPDIDSIFDYRLVRSLLTTDDRHQPQVLQIAVTILHFHLIGICRCNRQDSTEHRHVHRHRHTRKRLLEPDGQRAHIDLYASLSLHRLGILDLIRGDTQLEGTHNLIYQPRTFGGLLAGRMDDALHLCDRQPESGHHLQQPLL